MKIKNIFGKTTMFKKMLLLMTAVLFSVNGLVFAQSSMTIVDLPVTGTDAAIDINSTKTYTHTFDFGESDEATINGVEILAPFLGPLTATWEDVSPQGYGYVVDDSRETVSIASHAGNDVSAYCDGQSAAMLQDMIFLSRAHELGEGILVTLKDLVPGTQYSVRYYYRPWDPPLPRPLTILGDGASNGVFADSIQIDIDIDDIASPGAHYLDYTFVADDNDVTLKFIFHDHNQGPHIYGLTCEIVPQTDVGSKPNAKPSTYELMQNYPNPFNPTTQIQYTLGKNTKVEITVYDLLGHKVATLVNAYQNGGSHKVIWDASEASAGVYFYQMKTNDVVESKKMILVK